VICCRGSAEEALQAARTLLERLKLTMNETKTRRCRLPEDSFDFLGYTIGRCWSPRTGRAYLGTQPSRKSIQRLCREISDKTARRTLLLDPDQQVARLNRILVGWANYFCLGSVSKAYRGVDLHAMGRLRQWLRRKHKLKTRGIARYPDSYVYEKLGLVRLSERRRHFPWANA
jgi:RNA-directed DNA polymerase